MTYILVPNGDITLTLTTTKPPTELLVSSHHLTNASPYFKALLTGSFSEATDLDQNGHVEIPLPDDDAEAMLIVMKAVHGVWRGICPRLKLELLKNIAVVVDKYDLFDSVCTVLGTWVSTVRVGDRRARLQDVAVWFLCVAFVFNQGGAFQFATREFVLDTGGDVDVRGTCIPVTIADKIITRRTQLLRAFRKAIHYLRYQIYQDTCTICNPSCDSVIRVSLDTILALIDQGPRSKTKPRLIRQMVNDLYNNRTDEHGVIQDHANRLLYQEPPCIECLAELDLSVATEFKRVRGMVLSRYRGSSAKRNLDWSGCCTGLDRRLWPYH